MSLAALVISGWNWLPPVALLLAVSLGLVFWSYRRDQGNRPVRILCAALKILGLLTLGACLLEPLWSGQRARPGANLFVVLADNSQGLQIKDRGATQSRGEVLRNVLSGEKITWPTKLDENFQVRRYYFDSRLQSTRDFSELNFEGRSTSIGAALRNIAERYQGQPVSGVLLLTDGNATDLPDGRLEVTGLPPIYPVIIGKDDAIKDLSLQKVTASQTAFEDAPITIQADVASGGYSGQSIIAQLLDADGRKVEEKTQRARGDGELLPFHFELKPEKPGISFYRVRVSAQDEISQFDKPETSAEATLANNSRVIVANRGKGPYRILYVAGSPKWEFKFMNRALEEDDQIHLVSIIRVAKSEGRKFEFRGRPGETSNPLYRGFDNQEKEEVAQYNQPVLVRLNTRDEAELVGGFPKNAEELYQYSAIVIDDLEAEFFTRDQMTLVQKFVSERGGGFLMLGGSDSFHEGKYDRTPIGDMLPVYLDHIPAGPPAINEARLSLTKEGWLQPWARLRNTETEENKRLESMPPTEGVNRARELKPGASVIASVRDDHGDHPALAVQRFGNGRVAALMITGFWRWGMRDAAQHKDMDKAWRQLYRWLIADVPNRVDFQVEPKRNDPNQAVLLQIRVRDKVFQPMDNVTVAVNIRTVTNAPVGDRLVTTTNIVHLPAEPALTEAGLYEISYVPRETGGYLAEAVATDSAGAEAGRAEAAWTADPAADEFRSLKPNRALMEQIARQTGGQVIAADKLNAFAADLPNRKAPVTENWTYPIWHRSTVFLFALACFIAEWGIRRWRGMV